MKHFTNFDIARKLRQVAVAYTLKDESKHRFQIIAYNKAADAIDSSPTQLQDIFREEEKLDKIPGVGSSIASYIVELFEKGHVEHFDAVTKDVPPAVFPLLDIPKFGPKKAYRLVTTFHLKDPESVISDVEKLARDGSIAKLDGFGAKSAQDLLSGIELYHSGKSKSSRMALPYAHAVAEKIVAYLKKDKSVVEVQTLGSLRRMRDTIGDVDLAVASDDPKAVIDHFVKYPGIQEMIEKGPVSASFIATGGAQVDLMVQPKARFGALLQHFTGSKQHNVALRERAVRKGLSLSERGIKDVKKDFLHEFDNEGDFYKFLDMEYVEPELRENRGEIELAAKNALPKLVMLSDIRGDLHTHTNFDIEPSHDLGRDSIEQMAQAAHKFGYEYIGFADHNPSISGHSVSEIRDLIMSRSKKIEEYNKSNKSIRVFNLLEVDILPNGDLALDDDVLSLLDGAIVSLHSSFTQDRSKITKRILKGLDHPKVRIFGHPTGRLINSRAGADAEWIEVMKFCAERDIAMEINSSPQRLDLSDVMVKQAIELGCRVCIDTDSHSVDGLEMMQYGVSVARRGWCEKKNVVNTMPLKAFEKWLT